MHRPCAARVVVFDLGGVLVRICQSWAEGCAAAGLEYRLRDAEYDDIAEASAKLSVKLDRGEIDWDTWRRDLSRAMRNAYTPEEIGRVHRAWLLGQYDGVSNLIDRMHQAGLDTAALSNTDVTHWQRMDEFPAVMKVRRRLASFELGLHKPDPAIYREAERRLAVPAAHMLFFDDKPENVRAARTCGWQAERIDPAGAPAAQIERHLHDRGLLNSE